VVLAGRDRRRREGLRSEEREEQLRRQVKVPEEEREILKVPRLGRVRASADADFHASRVRPPTQAGIRGRAAAGAIARAASGERRTCGSPRIQIHPHFAGVRVGRQRVKAAVRQDRLPGVA
jgi:hypothetical protein